MILLMTQMLKTRIFFDSQDTDFSDTENLDTENQNQESEHLEKSHDYIITIEEISIDQSRSPHESSVEKFSDDGLIYAGKRKIYRSGEVQHRIR